MTGTATKTELKRIQLKIRFIETTVDYKTVFLENIHFNQ